MSKIDSESFNQYKLSNAIVKRICSGSYNEVIKNKGGIIDAAILSNVLDFTYLRGKTTVARSDEIGLSRAIEKDLNKLEESNPKIFDTRWKREETICIIFCLWKGIYDATKIKSFTSYASEQISIKLNGKDIMRLNKALEEFEDV